MGGLRSLAAPARPLCLGGIPHRPPPGGLWGTECCPFFCSICRPQSGRAGNETMAFFPGFLARSGFRLCFQSPQNAQFHRKNDWPVPELARSQLDLTVDQNALRSSLLAARDQTGPNRGIPGLLTGRSKARCWWPGSSPYRDA